MSQHEDPEEAAALAAFAELGRPTGGEAVTVAAPEDEVVEVLRRLDLEALGLLAYALDPVRPRPALRAELLERVSGDQTQEVSSLVSPPSVAPPPASGPAPRPAERAVPAPVARPAAPGFEPSAAGRRRRSRWPAVLAALFALAAIGLGVVSAYLYSELVSARGRLARLDDEAAARARAQAEEIAAVRAERDALAARFEFLSRPATTVFALRPSLEARQPLARGRLYVAPDHQHWQLEIAGLEPTPPGRDYQLWFLVEDVPRSGGTFKVGPERAALHGSDRMPPATTGVGITLERAGGAPAPTGAMLLVGDSPVTL